MLSPVERTSVPDRVFARLCEAIVAGHYAPGERLPAQRALAADLGVNMASVREALKRLQQLRLVEVRHGEPTRVLDWRQSGIEALALLGRVDGQVVGPLFEARRLLLTEVARLAAERRSAEQAEQIAALAGAVGAAADDEGAQLADWAFVAALVEAADNLVLQLIVSSVRELYLANASRFVALVSPRGEVEPLYREIAAAVGDGDGDAAATAMSRLAAIHERRMGNAA
ncbi:MAG: GntR family transcriptional regulator [Thermoleophilaceae bacterium]